MKKLLACAAVLGLLAFLPAVAQSNDHRGDRNNAASERPDRKTPPDRGRRDGQERTRPGSTPSTTTPPVMNNGGAMRPSNPAAAMPPDTRRSTSREINPSPQRRPTFDRNRNTPGWQGNERDRRPGANFQYGNSMRQHNNVARRPDVDALRHNMRSPKRFHSARYNPPRGYQNRHWSYGDRLPQGYFARNYWIANVVMFDLFTPPSGLVWVRVGDDAMLIERSSGDIVQVRYGVFY